MATSHYQARDSIKALLVGSASNIFVTPPQNSRCCDSMDFVGPVNHDSLIESVTEISPAVIIIAPSKHNLNKQLTMIKDARKSFIIHGISRSELVWSDSLSVPDDLIVMPCDTAELCLRISKLISPTMPTIESTVVTMGDLAVDRQSYTVTLRGQSLDLAWKEYQLLNFLMLSPGKVFTREKLLSEIWGIGYFGGTRTVDVHIRRLRQKLGTYGDEYFRTVKNVGYSFNTSAILPKKSGAAG